MWTYLERQGEDALILKHPEGPQDGQGELWRVPAADLEAAGLEPGDIFDVDVEGKIISSGVVPNPALEPSAKFGDRDIDALGERLRKLVEGGDNSD